MYGRCGWRASSVFCHALSWVVICCRSAFTRSRSCCSFWCAAWLFPATFSRCSICLWIRSSSNCALVADCMCPLLPLFGSVYTDSNIETRNSEAANTPSPSSRAGAAAAAAALCLCLRERLVGTAMESVNNPHTSPPAEFLDARDEVSIWLDIIAFRLHHHHEIALPLDIEQHACFSFSFTAQRVQRIHGSLGRAIQRNTNAQRTREHRLGLIERSDFADGELGIGAFLDAHTAAHEHGNLQFHFVLQPFVRLRENQHIHRPGHVFQAALRVEVAFIRLEHAHVDDDAAGINFIFSG